ncbi:hypothetical protein L249_5572 [Ophiocordyceps polyrhachis-furcata BCC 54312]|uniref:Major facilitator superfamily (MFS) profile domain-containing protein n=1 Tax=Ophiocordyceps polyrhachis-furcata BCC 54312 TaxID=1330021 RepID=A0A367LGX3_9HYPO|nr:hypothetical protein L249_5572 [Ophiocordyceps polyrhachis-furcata BCC 54312]
MPSQDSVTHEVGREQPMKEPDGPELGTSFSSSSEECTQVATVDAQSPIIHLHLTFDTILPMARRPIPGCGDALPPCPDLHRLRRPLYWSAARKYAILASSCVAVFLAAYAAAAYSPAAAVGMKELGTTPLVILLGTSTFCLGFGLGPMVLAPASETWGRYPIFIASAAVFVGCQALTPVIRNVAGVLAARFFVGVGASVFSIIGNGVIVDLWEEKDRNTPMALFAGFTMAGYSAGPLVATVLVRVIDQQSLLWKWIFWHQACVDAAVMTAFLFLYRESREAVVLANRARLLNKWYEELEGLGSYGVWISSADKACSLSASESSLGEANDLFADNGTSLGRVQRVRWVVVERPSVRRVMTTSILRPFYLLVMDPIVLFFSLWIAFAWGVLYLSFSVPPLLHQKDPDRSICAYGAMVAASAVGAGASITQQKLFENPQWSKHRDNACFRHTDSRFWAYVRRRFPADAPEARLYTTCITALFLPLGLLGAFVLPKYMGYAEAIGIGFAIWGIFSIYLASLNFLADAYGAYASSALASQNFCRNLIGGGFTLLTRVMLTNLGRQWMGIILGCIAVVLSVTPWVLVLFGKRLRSRSKFATSLQR